MTALPENLKKVFHSIQQQPQRQDSALAQLSDLRAFANRLGLYDAADLIRTLCERGGLSSSGIRTMRTPEPDGPISGEAIANRMMQICGCKGQHDCKCVAGEKQARIELWQAHNAAERRATKPVSLIHERE